MEAPFTSAQFFDVFRHYNEAIYPFQFTLYAMAAIALYLGLRNSISSDRWISFILGFFWLWMGVVYHILFFSEINKLAYAFGGLFILQGIFFLFYGTFRKKLSFQLKHNVYGYAGLILILFALIGYPILGASFGHQYPFSPTFGLPCPTTIFTFGIILLSERKFPVVLLLIPFAWSVVGFGAALNFGVLEDSFLFLSGLITLPLIAMHNKRHSTVILGHTL